MLHDNFMDVSIVILNYKQRGLVKQCIKGIVASQPQLEYEIIVVDNVSNDGTLEMVKTFNHYWFETVSLSPFPK